MDPFNENFKLNIFNSLHSSKVKKREAKKRKLPFILLKFCKKEKENQKLLLQYYELFVGSTLMV